MTPEERVGQVYGIYKVIGLDRSVKGSNKIYKCKCVYCGMEAIHSFVEMNKAQICIHTNRNGQYKDFSVKWKNGRLRHILSGMMDRCFNENNKSYRWYGAKGIKVCDNWVNNPISFEEWAINNSYDDSLTIDRIDENGDYCPENCRWVSNKDNAKYKSTTNIIIVDDESHTGQDWAKLLGFGINTINTYIRKYGLDDTVEFIKIYRDNPELAKKRKGRESLFDLYMS